MPGWALSDGDPDTVYTSNSRVTPLPTAPWGSLPSTYRAAKALALNATDKFLLEKKPHFTIVNVMPGYVLGRNELVTDAEKLIDGSNAIPLSIVNGAKGPFARPGITTDVRDVAKAQVESLDEEKVKSSTSFVMDVGNVVFDDVNEIVKRKFPDAVKAGVVSLGGSIPAVSQKVDVSETAKVFGPQRSFEDMVTSVVGQYIELKKL